MGKAKGAVHFFAERWEVVNEKEKTRRKRREHESQEEQTAAQRADATGERSTGRPAGDERVAKRAPESDMGGDRSSGRRANEPGACPTAPRLGADGGERGLAQDPTRRASAVCDLRGAALGTWRADPLHPNDRRASGQTNAHLWHLPRLWGRLFPRWKSS